RFRLSGHGHSMVITDLPGVGESRDRDAEYEALYRDILPELDLVLWLIKADVNRPGFPGECFICELRLPDHRFRWKHNKLF
ncbi:hypothetical protein FCY69_25965, partial [Escherichia coli]|nr:hypothetical protein [Escherichia coli]